MFYLTLHGETEWNRERRFQGQLDSRLTEHGVEQARLMGVTLRGLLGDSTGYAVVSSPLGRARRTAEIICQVLRIESRQIETDARLAKAARRGPAATTGTFDRPTARLSTT